MYTQTHTHLKFSAGLYTHNQCLKSPLDVTQATIKTYWVQNLQDLHFSLQTFSSSIIPHLSTWTHHPLWWKSQESMTSPSFPSRPAGPTCLLSNPSHLLTFPVILPPPATSPLTITGGLQRVPNQLSWQQLLIPTTHSPHSQSGPVKT